MSIHMEAESLMYTTGLSLQVRLQSGHSTVPTCGWCVTVTMPLLSSQCYSQSITAVSQGSPAGLGFMGLSTLSPGDLAVPLDRALLIIVLL